MTHSCVPGGQLFLAYAYSHPLNVHAQLSSGTKDLIFGIVFV